MKDVEHAQSNEEKGTKKEHHAQSVSLLYESIDSRIGRVA
jgi:hypothetical protein